jgi:excinuclease ABC subunit B
MMAEAKQEYETDADGAPVMKAADLPKDELARLIKQIEKEMKEAARALEFEKAAALRDQLMELRALQVVEGIAR